MKNAVAIAVRLILDAERVADLRTLESIATSKDFVRHPSLDSLALAVFDLGLKEQTRRENVYLERKGKSAESAAQRKIADARDAIVSSLLTPAQKAQLERETRKLLGRSSARPTPVAKRAKVSRAPRAKKTNALSSDARTVATPRADRPMHEDSRGLNEQ